MDERRREVVLVAIRERCLANRWGLLAAHVRKNHVHIVVESDASPDRVMNDVKSFASRCLNRAGFDVSDRKRWARHGSTRWLWTSDSVEAAVLYVVEGQGDAIAVYQNPAPRR